MAALLVGTGHEARHAPCVAVNTRGKVHLLWRGSDQKIHYRQGNGVDWDEESILPTPAPDNYFQSLAVGLKGLVHVVFTTRQPDSDPNTYSVFYVRRVGRQWEEPLQVSTEPYAQVPRIAFGPDATLHVLYQSSPSGQPSRILYSRGKARTWDTPRVIDEGLRPELAVDASGTIHAVWNAALTPYGIRYARCGSDGRWTQPVDIAAGSEQQIPTLAIDSQRRVHVVWYKGDDDTLSYAQITVDGKILVSTNLQSSLFKLSTWPRICVDCLDRVHVVFQGKTAPTDVWRVYHRVLEGSQWRDVARLDAPELPGQQQVPDISAQANRLASIWWQSDLNEYYADVREIECPEARTRMPKTTRVKVRTKTGASPRRRSGVGKSLKRKAR